MRTHIRWVRLAAIAVAIGWSSIDAAESDPPPVFWLSDETDESNDIDQARLTNFAGEVSADQKTEQKGKKADQKGCDHKGGGSKGCGACGANDPWRLFPELPGGIRVTGWLDVGATSASDRPANRFVRPVTFNDREEVQANQVYGVIERTVDDSGAFSIGGRLDILFGTDARFTEVPGLELDRDGSNGWNSRSFYRFSTPQAYAELAAGNFNLKLGHWYTLIGYELVTSPDNFFYSHAYTMAYGEPFTHTGILATYNRDRMSGFAAIHNGWDNFDATTDSAAYLGGMTWSSMDEATTLAVFSSHGDEVNTSGFYSQRSIYSVVLVRQLGDRLQYVLQHDNAWQENDGGPGVDAEWYGINQYLFYNINDCWTLGGRLEWFRDDDGVRVPNWDDTTGAAGSFYNATIGMNWKPCSNVTIRPEARWDWFDGVGNPYADGQRNDQFTAAFDMIVLF